MRLRRAWCLGMWVVLAAACGSNDDPSASDIWCGAVCAADARCGPLPPSCLTSCMQVNPQLTSRSASGATAQKPCLEHLSCGALGGDDAAWRAEQMACWAQAVMSVAVTERVRRFCPDHTLALFECGYTLSLDDCEHRYSMWNDAVIDRVAACDTNTACDERESCEQNVFAAL